MSNKKGYYNWIHQLKSASVSVQANELQKRMLNESGEEGLKQGRTRVMGHSRPSLTGEGDIATDPRSRHYRDETPATEDPIFKTAQSLGELLRKVNEGPGGPESTALPKGLQIPMDTDTMRKLLSIASQIHSGSRTEPAIGVDIGYEEVDPRNPETKRSIGKPATADEVAIYREMHPAFSSGPQLPVDMAPPGDMDGDGDVDANDVILADEEDAEGIIQTYSGTKGMGGIAAREGQDVVFPINRGNVNDLAKTMIDQFNDIVRTGNRGSLERHQMLMGDLMHHARQYGHHEAANALKGHLARFNLSVAQAARRGQVSPYEVNPPESVQEQKDYFINKKINKFFS